ncbi:glycoside hydrolase family 140 protein [Aquimarina sp. U1-2]|uniref:glycoside hydrolase family 140 protein n=1 Tax=Aquimarina sp. U1-2 TaxID=2823141 RepID=UPI001AECF528|nr:glycoside hydrolase family 140 protein [Aquimarina sp. U1-2]MBP2832875.1 glycoside hydrolase family 140 protein [Aquimarina sp. U1-2]
MKKLLYIVLLYLYFCNFSTGISQELPLLKVSESKRFLETEDETPFFWLGDTAWELFHRLSYEEAENYIKNRADKGFTVIQAVVLAELDGLTTPNFNGDLPLINQDPSRPNEAYLEHIDRVIALANKHGLYVGLLPTWGDKFNKKWGAGPEIFTPKNAAVFAGILAKRYQDKGVIWILGGDRNPEEDEDIQITNAMAIAIRKVVKEKQLITYHPQGGSSSADFFGDADWLDFTLYQSGHSDAYTPNYKQTKKEYNREKIRPVIDGEPCYEDHPIYWKAENGWFNEFHARRAGYWSMLAGACGHTYGNHNIWQMWQPERDPISSARTPWQQALDYPGAFQAGWMKKIFESRPWHQLVPNQKMIKSGPNHGGGDVLASIASDQSFAILYIPYGSNIEIDLSQISGTQKRAWWFNPRMGNSMDIGIIREDKNYVVDPPADPQEGNDWVLIIDDYSKHKKLLSNE